MARRNNTNGRTVTYNINHNNRKRYGLLNLLFDVLMICITAGFWLIWIFVREIRGLRG